jgi:hypothetical protein
MHKSTLTLLAALLTACGGPTPAAAPQVAAAQPPKTEAAAEPAKTEAPVDNRVLADSGIGVGGKLKAFQIVNCDSGDEYCQVCRYGGSPKVMAVGELDDPEFRNDIQNLDALVKKYGEDKLKAFAVIAEIKDGKGVTPAQDREALIARAKAVRAELGVTIPVVVPAAEEGGNKAFDDYYNITKGRTMMFADGRNAVRYSATAPTDLAALNDAIREVLGVTEAPAG